MEGGHNFWAQTDEVNSHINTFKPQKMSLEPIYRNKASIKPIHQ